ncbi:hypothetical protein BGX38DRAFT_1195410 [Terfezia claveryi]|nr:hypothetical protein BGX38DRAFT_1195410 [Terfezia claveryi]
MAAPEPPQPDFNVMSDNLNNIGLSAGELARQFARFPNVPAFDHGAQLLAELRDMRDEIRSRFQAADHNALARLTNSSFALTADSHLSALRTGLNEDVDNFPPTLGALDRLRSAEINALLRVYGLPTQGLLADRQRLFKKFIGIVVTGVYFFFLVAFIIAFIMGFDQL